MTSATIQDIRYELADTSDLPVMSDAEIQYYLTKHDGNLNRTSMDVAKAMLFKLSMAGSETVDIFSINGSRAAAQYIAALKMYIKDPSLNPFIQTAMPYAGGISKSDMEANDANPDNNFVQKPSEDRTEVPQSYFEV